MIVFDILLNGRKLVSSGLDGPGVLTAIISLVRNRNDSRLKESITLDVGGLNDQGPLGKEDLKWLHKSLSIGHELTIRVSRADSCDPPRQRKSEDPKVTLENKRKYLKILKRQVGEK